MAKKPDELLELVKPWGIEEEARKALVEYLKSSDTATDIDSWIRDRRTAEQFSEQMKAYWAVEDAFAVWLERNLKNSYPTARVIIAGSDQERKIIQGQSPKGKVTGQPDYSVFLDNESDPIAVEFQFGTVELDAYDVKKNKVNKAEKQNGVILFAFLPQQKFTIMTPKFIKENGQLFINPRIGGKETWNIAKEKIVMKPKDFLINEENLRKGFS